MIFCEVTITMDDYGTQTTTEEIFEIRTANETLSEGADDDPKMLFGDLWLTGEVSVMFADAGCGKSLLAVQIGESIARGRPIEPMEMTVRAQKVLYIDLEQSASQFRRRYTEEAELGSMRRLSPRAKRHRFSDSFLRPSIRNATYLKAANLAPMIEKSGAKVVIIDNIAFLQKYMIPRETAAVMLELRRLRNRYGLSILVLTHTARPVRRRGISASDMACSSVMANYADNIFAIGTSGADSSMRYVKHIKPGAAALAFGSAHLPYFRIVKIDDKFPAFKFLDYHSEDCVVAGDGANFEWSRVREIKRLSEDGNSIRRIAALLKMSKTTVQRYLKMAPAVLETPKKKSEPVFYMFERCLYERCFGCGMCSRRAAHNRFLVQSNIHGHDDCPDDCDICGPLRYSPNDTDVDPHLKQLSDEHYEQLREWLIGGKKAQRPIYPGARRYGRVSTNWRPGTEPSPEEEMDELVATLM